jgi:hypothetical protein
MTTAENARSRVCELLEKEMSTRCDHMRGSGVFLRRVNRGPDGTLKYEVASRVRVGEHLEQAEITLAHGMVVPVEYD